MAITIGNTDYREAPAVKRYFEKAGSKSLLVMAVLPRVVPASSSSRGGDVTVYVYYTFFNSVLVSVSIFMALSTVFHSLNPPDNSPFSHSVLPVSSLPYWSFQLLVSLGKSPSALI